MKLICDLQRILNCFVIFLFLCIWSLQTQIQGSFLNFMFNRTIWHKQKGKKMQFMMKMCAKTILQMAQHCYYCCFFFKKNKN